MMTRALTTLLTSLAVLGAAVQSAQARGTMRSIFQDDCLLIRISPEPRCYGASPGEAVDVMKSLGADMVRVTVVRDKTESPGWANFDIAVRDILNRRLAPLLLLTDRQRTPSVRGFTRFVQAAVRRYPRVHNWSIYNEPNLRYWLRSRSARDYRNLFVASQAAIREVRGHERDTVLMGELAPHATANGGTAVAPLRFMRELFCLDSRLRPYAGRAARSRGCTRFKRVTASGFAVHPYTNSARNSPRVIDRRDQMSVSTLGRVTRILDAAVRRRRANRMSIWNTEMGFRSNPPDLGAPSPARQAEYINQADWIQFRNPRVTTTSQYLLDDGPRARDAFNTALRFNNRRAKPSFGAYRLPIWTTKAGRGSVRVWGQVRPGRVNRVTIQRQSRGRGRWREAATLRTNGSGYFQRRVRGAGRDRFRLAWGRFRSRVDRIH